ncbi:unnamed protein product, partial [Brachionus calyciflorus]
FYCTEAIALYDYKGRSDKEISFKKGSLLAIRGQLSADWWQGSLLSPGSNGSINSSTPTRIGYIPDKYIALRSSRKRIQSNVSTPQTTLTQNSKIATNLMSTSMKDNLILTKTPISTQSQTSNSLNNVNTPIKESDIIDDDETSSSISHYTSPSIRSMSTSSTSNTTKSKTLFPDKKRNLSTNTTNLSDYSLIQSTNQVSYYTQKFKTTTPKLQQQSSLDDILTNGKNKIKMNQIEDALASVLDDMKQLDFKNKQETTKRPDLVIDLPINLLMNTPQKSPRSLSLSGEKSEEQLKSLSTTSTDSSLTSSSTSSIKEIDKFEIKKQPPPLMKKPEISDEILKKLGRSPTNGEIDRSECSSPTGSVFSNGNSTPNQNNTNQKSNLSVRLSNSKATDV